MTMSRELNPKSDVCRICVCKKDGGRGLVSIESCIRDEENNHTGYVRHNTEDRLEMVKLYEHLNVTDFVDPKQFKKQNKENIKNWHNHKLHDQFLNEKEETDWNKNWQWIRKGDLKGCISIILTTP